MKRLRQGDSGSKTVGSTCVSGSSPNPRSSSPEKRPCLADISKMSRNQWLWNNTEEEEEGFHHWSRKTEPMAIHIVQTVDFNGQAWISHYSTSCKYSGQTSTATGESTTATYNFWEEEP